MHGYFSISPLSFLGSPHATARKNKKDLKAMKRFLEDVRVELIKKPFSISLEKGSNSWPFERPDT
jgi:hypothetical protein